MLILFDEATPVPIRAYLKGHSVRTAFQQNWDKLKNGDLLAAAEQAEFELFLTPDKNVSYQQNLKGRKIAIVVPGLQDWRKLRPRIQRVVDAVNAAVPGSFTAVEIPRP